MATGAVIARIISQYSDKGTKAAQKDLAKLGKTIDGFGRKALKSIGLVSVATAGLAVKLGKDAVQGAMEDQKQQQALAIALRNTTGATEQAIEANTRYLDQLELQVAIDNKELIPSLQKLVTATGNLSRAQELLTLATDVSAASGKDLGTVTTALSRAVRGNFTALTKLGLPLDQAAVKAKNFSKIQKDLAAISKGQAAAAANTFAGRLTTLQLRFNQITDRVGYALIPVLERLVDRLENDVFPAFDKFIRMNQKEIVEAFAGTINLVEKFAKAMIDLSGILIDLQPLLKILASGILSIIGYVKLLAAIQSLQGLTQFLAGATATFRKELLLIGPATKAASDSFVILGVNAAKLGRGLKGIGEVASLSGKIKMFGTALVAALTPATIIFFKIAIAIAAIYAAYKGLKWLLEKFARDDRKRAAQKEYDLLIEKHRLSEVGKSYEQLSSTMIKTGRSSDYVRDRILEGFKALEDQAKAAKEQAAKDAADRAREARLLAEQIADEQKRLYIKNLEAKAAAKLRTLNRNFLTDEKKMAVQLAAIKKKNAQLDKAGIKLTDPDEMTAIQMEAIYQNLIKGGKVLLAEVTKQQKAADDLKIKAAEEYNKLLERQQDILKALSGDNKVTAEEVGLLAKQWGMTAEAAQYYVEEVLAIGDQKISTDEVNKLALMWFGNTGQSATEKAKKYLDFLNEIDKGNGSISTEGIKRLAQAWYGGTGEDATNAARKYEQAVMALKDASISDKEIIALRDAWNVSEDAVVEYLLSVGKPFTVSDSAKLLLSPDMIDRIAASWDKARLALEKYLKAASAGIPGGNGDLGTGTGNDPAVIAAAEKAANEAAAAAADAAAVAAEAEAAAAEAEAAAAAVSGMFLNSIREATTNEALNAAVQVAQVVGESASDIANAMMVGLLGQGVDAANAASSARYTGMAIAAQQAAAAKAQADAEAAARALSSGQVRARDLEIGIGSYSGVSPDYDEKFRFQAFNSPTASSGSSIGGGNLMAAPVVNVTVQGSVTSEQDLVQTIRQGLLYGQGNGDGITLQAI